MALSIFLTDGTYIIIFHHYLFYVQVISLSFVRDKQCFWMSTHLYLSSCLFKEEHSSLIVKTFTYNRSSSSSRKVVVLKLVRKVNQNLFFLRENSKNEYHRLIPLVYLKNNYSLLIEMFFFFFFFLI